MAEPTMREVLAELEALRVEMRRRVPARPALLHRTVPSLSAPASLPWCRFSLLAAPPRCTAPTSRRSALGITTGFENPDNPETRHYNPTGTVTRQEMATFLARTAGLSRVGRASVNVSLRSPPRHKR